MDKGEFAQPDADSFELISKTDALDSFSSTDSGIPLSNAEKALADRVRHLQQENKEIRSAIDNYQKALQLCQDSLNNVIDREGQILSVAQNKYNEAKLKVENQGEKISSLQKQLEEEKKKHANYGEAIPDEKQQGEKHDFEKLEEVAEKNTFEEKACSLLHQFVGTLSGLTLDECKTSMSADLLQDMINLSIEMEKYIKPLSESGNAAIEEKHALEDELKFVKEQLKLGEQRQAELEATIDKYQELIENKKTERADFQEVKEELKLLNEDMEKIDMVRAGCVSHDSQATEGSLYSNLPGQQQSVDTSLCLKHENEIQELKEQLSKEKEVHKRENNNRRSVNDKREAKFLKEKEDLKKKVEELTARLNEKADESALQKAEEEKIKINEEINKINEENIKINEELEEQRVRYITIQEELCQRISTYEAKEMELNENILQLRQELRAKEDIQIELKAQVYTLCQEIEEKDVQYEDSNQRLNLSEIEHKKMIYALEEMRKELDSVYAQNEKFLTERKGANEVELVALQSTIDNLTAQLLSAEEMLEHKENDLRKLHDERKGLASELETVPLLKQQLDVFQADFNTERQTRQKVEDDNRKLRDEVAKLHADNERLVEEATDPTGSKLAEMQRRHGCGNMQVGSGNDNNPWSGFYDQYLAPQNDQYITPRGPAVAQSSVHRPLHDNDMNRQVSGGRCPKCDLMFPDLDTLQTHVVGCLESESTGSVGGKICPKCQESFPDLDTLQIHVMECLDN